MSLYRFYSSIIDFYDTTVASWRQENRVAAARQPTRAEIKTRYNEVDCNAGGDMDLCDTGTTWDTSTTIKMCKCDSTGANTQPSRTDIKDMYNNGGNCNAGGNITLTLCGTGTAWNSTIKRCKCDSTEAATCDGSAITETDATRTGGSATNGPTGTAGATEANDVTIIFTCDYGGGVGAAAATNTWTCDESTGLFTNEGTAVSCPAAAPSPAAAPAP